MADLLGRLGSSDPPTRAAAAWRLAGATGVDHSTIGSLEALLRDSNKAVRYSAAWALGHLTKPETYYDRPPTIRNQTRPVYPQQAFDDKVEGTVLVELLIGEDGEVAHRELRTSIPALDAAALACVEQWRFKPAMRGELPVATLAQAPVTFRIY